MDEPLLNTNVTGNVIKMALLEPFGLVAAHRLRSITATVVGKDTGFLSHVFMLHLDWQKDDGKALKLPNTLILKTTTANYFTDLISDQGVSSPSQEAAQVMDMACIHNVECEVYDIFMKNVIGCCIPKCYVAWKMLPDPTHPALIIMEDLSGRAKHCPMMDGMSLEQLMSTAETIAHVHAWSLMTDYDWRSRLITREEMYVKMEKIILFYANLLDQSVERYPDLLGGVDKTMLKAFFDDRQHLREICLPSDDNDFPLVFCHGDLWINNLLFNIDRDGRVGNQLMAIIDWQLAHQGSLFEDLAPMFTLSVPTELRRSCTQTCFHHYYSTITEVTRPKNIQLPPYDRMLELFMKFTSMQQLFYLCGLASVAPLCSGGDRNVEYALVSRALDTYQDAVKVLKLE